jgi:methenyltetrahydromethanopterin cyclohydrolase
MIANLNGRALRVVEDILSHAEERKVAVHFIDGGGRVIDCGIHARGGFAAGIDLARACMADLAQISIIPGDISGQAVPYVQVATDHPVQACLASQYAGWAISVKDEKYFAMGSGPMRAANGHEPIYDAIGFRETSPLVVGVLETGKLPSAAVVAKIAEGCRIPASSVTLLAAPTASIAGGIQVVARSIETAMHKLAELKFDLTRVVSAHGSAPLPPVAKNDLAAIGRTNDSMLYGARVNLYVSGDDETLDSVGPLVPSSASRDYGEPFEAIFSRYHHDFYAVDPMLFSPAEIVLQNIETGRVHAFGSIDPEVLTRSFFS